MPTTNIYDHAPGSAEQSHDSWRVLYQAAIFEDDKAKLAARITAAENALRANASTLAGNREDNKEWRDMEQAIYFLKLLGRQEWS